MRGFFKKSNIVFFIAFFSVSAVFYFLIFSDTEASSSGVEITDDIIWDADGVGVDIYIDAGSDFNNLEVSGTYLNVYEVSANNFFLLKTDTRNVLRLTPTDNALDFSVPNTGISSVGYLSGWDIDSSGQISYIIGTTDPESDYAVTKNGTEIGESPVNSSVSEEVSFSTTAGIGSYAIFGGSDTCNTTNVRGYAWSDGIGWISFSCMDEYDIGTGINYGVNINEDTKDVSGYAWSDSVGWISFNESDLNVAECPDYPEDCSARLSGTRLIGWAKVLSNDEWISFYGDAGGDTYGPYIAAGDFHGWAWGEDLPGWISFNCENTVGECTVSDYKVWTTIVLEELIVRTDPASKSSSATGDSAFLNGMLLGMGGDLEADVWFAWGESEGSLINETTPQTISGVGGFNEEITFGEAEFGETYYFKAMAENSGDSAEGSVMSFTISKSEGDIIIKRKDKQKTIVIGEEGTLEIQ